jgi:hypothetical protein
VAGFNGFGADVGKRLFGAGVTVAPIAEARIVTVGATNALPAAGVDVAVRVAVGRRVPVGDGMGVEVDVGVGVRVGVEVGCADDEVAVGVGVGVVSTPAITITISECCRD